MEIGFYVSTTNGFIPYLVYLYIYINTFTDTKLYNRCIWQHLNLPPALGVMFYTNEYTLNIIGKMEIAYLYVRQMEMMRSYICVFRKNYFLPRGKNTTYINVHKQQL